ncbi:MAG TPA: preprotein translocase subunit YajC [Acidimicrobiia bacterium]|nr:preprotein translocase subunit YajC [Acidimicrobiia bacterium]
MPVVFAQEAPAGSGTSSLIFLVLMVAVFYFLIIRPQRNRMKKQQELAQTLQLGDEIQTIGGIKGKVKRLDGDDVVIQIEQGELRISRRAVANRIGPEAEASSE